MRTEPLPSLPGVYALENADNGKLYIGSTINLRRRVQHHLRLLNQGTHHNPYLQRAYRKHRFVVVVLEVLPTATAAEALQAEQAWLDAFRPTQARRGYNAHPTAASSTTIRAPGEEFARIRPRLLARRRGTLTSEGRDRKAAAAAARWAEDGEKTFFAETMRERWAMPEHRAKVRAGADRYRDSPGGLEAMQQRIADARRSRRWRASLLDWWRQHHAAGRFASAEEFDEWLAAEYRAGRSARDIGREIGLAHNAVARHLRDHGVEVAVRGQGRSCPALTARNLARAGIEDVAAFDQAVAALHDQGCSNNEIRLAYGVSADAIRNALKRTGRQCRGRSEAQRLRHSASTLEGVAPSAIGPREP